MEFFNEHDEKSYIHIVELYKEWTERDLPIPVHDCIEVREYGDVKMFRWPTSIHWWRFYGTFEELHDKLKNDLPQMCPDAKFYSTFISPILI